MSRTLWKKRRTERKKEPPIRVGRDVNLRGVAPGSPEAAICEGEAATAIEILGEGRTLAKTVELATNAQGWADRIIEQIRAVSPQKDVCRAGCFYCCAVKVSTDAAEVLAIAECVRATFSEEQLAALRARLAQYIENASGSSGHAYMVNRQWCPLLVDGRCSVYARRPLVCRAWNSQDVEACRADYEHPEANLSATINGVQYMIGQVIGAGLKCGLIYSGLQGETVDLVKALGVALDAETDLEELNARWRAGEPVFRAAEHDLETRGAIESAADHNLARVLSGTALAKEDAAASDEPHDGAS